ncbi:MAG TPA: DUF2069 domain-containing protein [Burkholderiales bacterium]|nr:DUF2069 domain-containing protein [Burkholderiales bacterium]
MVTTLLQLSASVSLIALLFLCLLWETTLSPIRPGGSLLFLKALPLLLPLFGVLRGKIYTYQWAVLLVLAYFCEGVVRAWSERGVSRVLSAVEIALSVDFVLSAALYVRVSRQRVGRLPSA